jgi:hypothetical protein
LFSPAPDDESDANKKITKEFTMQTPFRLPLLTALILRPPQPGPPMRRSKAAR